MAEIPKAYEPQSVEDKWYDFWLKQSCFTADPARVSDQRPAYSIVIPPPNVTGMLHMGHVLNNTIQDILARKARMDGKEVLWLPGTDHAGIATEGMVAKQIWKEEKKSKRDIGREEFIRRVWQWKEKHGGIIIEQLKKLGCSCDWTRERFTMDEHYVRCVQRVFVALYKKGLIYRGKRMVNWCPATQTALSDEEVEMESQKGFLYYFKVQVVDATPSSRAGASGTGSEGAPGTSCDGGVAATFLTIATTRPETIPGDTAVAVHPKDTRYAHLIGKHVIRPLPAELPTERKLIPIIGDEYVDFEFGTGVLKVTPAHDKNDFEIGQRHKLAGVDIMNPNGSMNDLAGKHLAGLDRFEARKIAVEKLKELGALEKEEPYENKIGFSQRARVPIEPRLSEQWFLKYPAVEQSKACVEQEGSTPATGVADRALAGSTGDIQQSGNATTSARARATDGASATAPGAGALPGKMRFHPQRWAKVYDHWLTNIQDWCISRQLWWGHRIPVWYSEGWKKLPRVMVVVELRGDELTGSNIKELRRSAFAFAKARGIIGQDFLNLDTGQTITVHKASLEHAFSNFGVANVKLVPGLPELLRHAIRVSVEPHVPASNDVKAVETYFGALHLGDQFFRVKFRVKVFAPNFRLYDHQTLLLWKEKANEPDGNKSPEATAPKGETSRPASGSRITLADLVLDVNADAAFTRCQMEAPHESWEQDPDVLDTWFSSWLWPFATMGWPQQTDTLKKFYPTTDLVTGPDIIFFWVARMIMAGYEFMGELPFRNVYFTGIIRDKQGRKMSKTLGNSPDPLELIAKYGADALRFGTMRSAPLGQDVLFDEKDVELGRNFCNKLWNACRYRQLVGQASRLSLSDSGTPLKNETGATPVLRDEVQGEINPSLLTNDDKWILLKLHQAIKEITEALDTYNFNTAVQTLYRFFWSEYCDWYVEATKAVLSRPASNASPSPLKGERAGVRDEQKSDASHKTETPPHPDPLPPAARGGEGTAIEQSTNIETSSGSTPQLFNTSTSDVRRTNTLAVIDFVLSHTLRLFHPFLPFITEELWHGMGYADDMPENQGGKTIMNAPWPKPFDGDFRDHYALDDCYLEFAQAKYDLVTEGRNLKRIGNIPGGKKVRFIFKPVNPIRPHDAEVVKILLNAEALEIVEDYQPKKGTPTAHTPMGELFLPLEGLVDVEAEKARLKKELEKVLAEIAKVEQKLANPAFVQKVPPQVLQEHQQRLADWQAKKQKLEEALKGLEG